MNEMNKMHAVSDEKLESVTGGDITIGNYRFSGYVDKYHGVVGQYYYIVPNRYNDEWWYGRMTKTYEQSLDLGMTKRTHKFIAELHNGVQTFGCEKYFCGDDVTLYTTIVQQ